MRISVYLVIFLILFNGWAGLLQQYDIDDHLGINAEVGDHEELEQAVDESQEASEIGSGGIFESLVGMVSSAFNTFTSILIGTQPGLQMLTNVLPRGPAQDLAVVGYSIVPIIVGIDVLAFARGQGGF